MWLDYTVTQSWLEFYIQRSKSQSKMLKQMTEFTFTKTLLIRKVPNYHSEWRKTTFETAFAHVGLGWGVIINGGCTLHTFVEFGIPPKLLGQFTRSTTYQASFDFRIKINKIKYKKNTLLNTKIELWWLFIKQVYENYISYTSLLPSTYFLDSLWRLWNLFYCLSLI